MRRLLFITLFTLATWALHAQDTRVSGTVVDSHNEPIPGATVEIVGRSETATTDIDGRFIINLPVTAKKIRVTYPGFRPVEAKVSDNMLIKMGSSGWASSPSGFRSFLDLQGGFGIGGKVNVAAGDLLIKDLGTLATFGLNTSYGYQINRNLFVGLGFGAYINLTGSKSFMPNGDYWEHTDSYYVESENNINAIRIPIFAEARWDFGLDKKTAPYVDLKAGYQCTFQFEGDGDEQVANAYDYWQLSQELTVYGRNASGVFLQPSVGFRTSLGGKSGINIGVAYSIVIPRKYTTEYRYEEPRPDRDYYMQWSHSETKETKPIRSGAVLLNIGFDF